MILIVSQLLFYFFIIPPLSYGADTLNANQSISGNQTLVSLDGNFEMGFFKPGKSPNYYIGIWYKKVSTRTIVWVANRETRISDSSSKLKIMDGNLVLLDESNIQIWSTNIISTTTPASVVLHDDGNLVLRYGSNISSPPIWQSFDHPTHTLLPRYEVTIQQAYEYEAGY
ncbi:putative non-specific serine/threonine protein kinase [Helianthus annuus]|uniref:Non-specific serine/threonine protein kinase n=1 Tax=Helianthus annuus TaxID=4232 RepID=A0A9K3E058_HELAN|nr:putative non-specific serine/threonine protein kinase [Helianthus annuus]KAJ0451190.1 putative non-specific serine/threonine protein kinase [Helianthus annuus]KAJ0455620.1 putative non-specific serine/threonine protein kinase [Helianthus annuus]KAJ0473059.1 putative non-specific serine/threonine protein kinase [Helianthus annuus]KAJ0648661.1 putative non-specific serine/threonine protein kinase [Helianthus annuus]